MIDADKIAKAIVQKVRQIARGRQTSHEMTHGDVAINKRHVETMQGRRGYRRVVKAFGTDILQADGAP